MSISDKSNSQIYKKLYRRYNGFLRMHKYSEIKNEVKDLSKRVETLENQMKKDKEEQLNKLKAELDYAKFCSALEEMRIKNYKM